METSEPSGVRVARADPKDPRLVELIARHIAYGDAHYRAESNHHMTPDELATAGADFFAIWLGDEAIGMGALAALGEDGAEVKSMHVLERFRGQGLGARMLDHLISEARKAGYRGLWLETGSREASAAARSVYAARGFRACPPFGEYVEDPESVFMMLSLD